MGGSFSPDGTLFVLPEGPDIKLWSTTELGTCVATFENAHRGPARIYSTVFFPGGKRVLSCSSDATIKMWEVETQSCLKTFHGHARGVLCAAVTPNETTIASGSFDCTIKLWSVAGGVCIQTLRVHTGVVQSVAFSPDGLLLASGAGDRIMHVYSLKTWTSLKFTEHEKTVVTVAFSPDGKTIVSGSLDGEMKLWSPDSATSLKTFSTCPAKTFGFALSPDGKVVLRGDHNGAMRFFSVQNGSCVATLTTSSKYRITAVVFSPDGRNILCCMGGGEWNLWRDPSC